MTGEENSISAWSICLKMLQDIFIIQTHDGNNLTVTSALMPEMQAFIKPLLFQWPTSINTMRDVSILQVDDTIAEARQLRSKVETACHG